MKFDQPPDDVEWNDWGPPVRVKIEHGPVMLFARAVKDSSAIYASERAAERAGFATVPVPPTYTFVMSAAGAFPDIQPEGGTGSMYSASGVDAGRAFARDGLFLHGEQHFTYHRPVAVGDVLEGRMRHLDADRAGSPSRPDGSDLLPNDVVRSRRRPGRRRTHRVALLPEPVDGPERAPAATSRGDRGRRDGVRPGESGANPRARFGQDPSSDAPGSYFSPLACTT